MKQQKKYFQVLNKELVLEENSFSLRLLSTFMIHCKPSKWKKETTNQKKTHTKKKPQSNTYSAFFAAISVNTYTRHASEDKGKKRN